MKKEKKSAGKVPHAKEQASPEQNISHDKKHTEPTGNKTEYDKLKEEFDSLKSLLQRLQADHENYRKRVEQNNQIIVKNSNKDLILDLIPVLDHFELALSKADGNDPFVQGIQLIHTQIIQVLEKYGVSIINAKDCTFDPHQHEAVCVEEGDCEDNSVICEMQKGYKLQDTILRHAKVKIGKKRQEQDEQKNQ